ncbi:MAG TPA: transporter [Burkholderiales bacterium]|nr:transporter [Burkholderiales bacterium]
MLPRPLETFALLLTSLPVWAAGPIDTDGPDFVESSEVVGNARFQYEAELTQERDRRIPSSRTTTATPTLLKYGITDTVELRVQTEGYIRVADESAGASDSPRTGLGDTALGLKWHSQDRDASTGKPAISWILHFDTPSGTNGFEGQGIRPSLRSVVTWDLPHDLSLGVMPGIKYDGEGRRFTSGIFGTVLNKRISDKFRAFVELSAPQLARNQNGGTLASWDVGAARLLTDDTQIGVRASVAANRNTPNASLLFELAQRY